MSPVIMTSVIRRALWWPDAWTRSPALFQDWYCLWQLCHIFPKSFSLISRHEALKIWADCKAGVPSLLPHIVLVDGWRKNKCGVFYSTILSNVRWDDINLSFLYWLCSLAIDIKCDWVWIHQDGRNSYMIIRMICFLFALKHNLTTRLVNTEAAYSIFICYIRAHRNILALQCNVRLCFSSYLNENVSCLLYI